MTIIRRDAVIGMKGTDNASEMMLLTSSITHSVPLH